jgi:hypothetical protein
MLHLPILRAGVEYRSVESAVLPHVATGKPVAEVSQANRGLIARDLLASPQRRARLAEIPASDLAAISRRAAGLFATADLPFYGGVQSPADFVRQQSSTTGMPEALCRANLEKVRYVLAEVERVVGALTRGLDLSLLDTGVGTQDGWTLSYLPQADALGCILPGNSPGVHSLWAPAIALKMPLVLKPGRLEPWTPHRVAQAFLAAGCLGRSASTRPTTPAGQICSARTLVLFGDASGARPGTTTRCSTARAGARCCQPTGDWGAPRPDGDLVARTAAVRCVAPRASGCRRAGWRSPRRWRAPGPNRGAPLDDPGAPLRPDAGWRAISDNIDRLLVVPGAEDVTARVRGTGAWPGGRRTFLLPTVIHCDDRASAGLLRFLFPFATVVGCPRTDGTASNRRSWRRAHPAAPRQALFACPGIDR